MNVVSLAERLQITIAEAEQMSLTELNEWLAYFIIKSEKKDG
tara:strand:+ start:93 stop:218 length:126 start_codon:yes stop_codon:yes gene_type:complete